MKRFLHTCILVFGVVYTSHAQVDPMFFQQTGNRMLVNPASAGKGGDITAALAVRQQWIGFPGAPVTQALYVNGFVQPMRSGFGLSLINDKFGPQSTKNIKLNYAYFVPFEEIAFLSLGLGMGVMNNTYNEIGLIPRDPDTDLILEKRSKTVPDFDFGFEFDTRYVELGASVTHITYGNRDQNLVRPIRNFYVYSRVKLPVNKYWDFIPGVTWHNNSCKLNTYEVNAAFRYNNNICVNFIYRNPMDCGIAFGATILGSVRLAYSYNYGFDNLSAYNDGSHEITISYTIPVNNSFVKTKLRFFRWKMF